jgi:hypothetical protein
MGAPMNTSLLDQISQKNAGMKQTVDDGMNKKMQEQAATHPLQQEAKDEADRKQMLMNSPKTNVQHLKATPEQEKERASLTIQTKKLMFEGERPDALAKALAAGSNPKKGISSIAHDIMTVMEKKNPKADSMALGETLMDVIDDLAEFAQSVRPDLKLDQDDMVDIMSQTAETYMRSRPEEYTKEKLRGGYLR